MSFASAKEYVIEYAENLSQGGIFVKGASDLEPLSEVDVDLTLPGYGSFRVTTMVAHVLDAGGAASQGRSAGAGLAIVKRPDGFDEALHAYLMTLGRRADVMVLVASDTFGLLLSAAGYQVRTLPDPDGLVAVLAGTSVPIAGIVVPVTSVSRYESAISRAGGGTPVLVMDSAEEFDDVLVRLDAEL